MIKEFEMNRKALSLAVGAAVVFGAAQQAQADELLFPFFQSGAGSWTFLSLRSDGGNLNPGTNGSPTTRPTIRSPTSSTTMTRSPDPARTSMFRAR